MSDQHTVASSDDSNHDQVLWGAEQIGAEVNLSENSAKYLLENGLLPGRKIGARWVSTRRRLRDKIWET